MRLLIILKLSWQIKLSAIFLVLDIHFITYRDYSPQRLLYSIWIGILYIDSFEIRHSSKYNPIYLSIKKGE